jgi:hypothetical protein
VLGLVALPVLAAFAVRPAWRTRDATPVTMVALGAGWLVGMGWSAKAFNGYLDLFDLLPFAAIGLGGIFAAVLGWARTRVDARVTTAVAIGLAVVLTAFATVTSVTTRSDTLLTQRASVAAALSHAPPGATILSIQAPEALVLAHRQNPTNIQMFTNGFSHYVDDTWPGGLKGYADHIEQTRPDLIAMQNGLTPQWLSPVLAQDYRRVGRGPTFAWWASTELPKSVRRSIHAAHARVMAR